MSFRKPHVVTIEVATAEIAEVRIDPIHNHRALYSRREFKPEEVISEFTSRSIYQHPNYLTVQLGDNEHIELFPEFLECINHSCDPNCFFDTDKMQLIALKTISEGEEMTFFYPSTEWDMDQAFQCHCGTANCIESIKGAKYLSKSTVKNYRFTSFIKQKLASA
ncbi:MAG: SET domain-containing protein-lysine N-methyltransferase [Marivirga sp.]|nr:SET domain-containing protein-lysine N-methyltransferase [Marivirga sp.]